MGRLAVIYDPVTTDCGSNGVTGTTTNTTGCFLAVSSTGNTVFIIDPIANVQSGFRVGINPTAMGAGNYRTSTHNHHQYGSSHTITGGRLPWPEDTFGIGSIRRRPAANSRPGSST